MRKIIILFFLLLISALGYFFLIKQRTDKVDKAISKKNISPSVRQDEKTITTSKSIFIPYWSLDKESLDLSQYDTLIYFGVAANFEGINKSEPGFSGMEKFLKLPSSGKERILTLRMINDEINSYVLKNVKVQEKIISDIEEILDQYDFTGLILDLEISNLINKDIKKQINDFVQLFYSSLNTDYRKFYLTIYGDTFFRGRPYDIPVLTKNSDGIFIMAYDFHKSRGEPGPNFPFESGAKYQYNFKTMISDFSKFIPPKKLTVVFGMFGYDWLVDEKKRPIRPAQALSYNEIKTMFLDKCEFKNCVIKRDSLSKESEINYIVSSQTPDEQDIYRIDYHIVWFEDKESVELKTEHLQEQGIGNISFWAYGYF